jgi:hypothetical protein
LKNFPHQINDLDKLTAALGVANVLIGTNNDLSDDGVLGEALANAGVYTFRNKTKTVATNIAAEKQKALGNQGFRTAARDIRRFFLLANLLTSALNITQRGQSLLDAAGNVPLRNALWRDAMLQLNLLDAAGNASHPYRVLMRLVADHPGIETTKLLLALEAKDDSAAEYARVSALAALAVPDIIQSLNIGKANARNATKILPAIAEQIGDILRQGNHTFLGTQSSATEDTLIEEEGGDYEKSVPPTPLAVTPASISPLPNFAAAAQTSVDMSAAIEIRKKRTIEHHKAVTSVATILDHSGFLLYERPFDCLGHKAGAGSLLVEVKTLDGTRSDERHQSEKALGQLRGYRFFNVPAAMKAPKIVEIVAYTAVPSSDAIHFMRDNTVCSAWPDKGVWHASDLAGNIANFSPDDLVGH